MTNDELFVMLHKQIKTDSKEVYNSPYTQRTNYVITWVRLGQHLKHGGVIGYINTTNVYEDGRSAEIYAKLIFNALMRHDPENAKISFASYLGMTLDEFQQMLTWEESPHAS